MAAVNTEVTAVQVGPVKMVAGTAVTTGATTSVIVAPGYNANGSDVLLAQGSVNANIGVRKVSGWSFTNNANSNAFTVVKSYDSTADRDILTVTCTAADSFDYVVFGTDSGVAT